MPDRPIRHHEVHGLHRVILDDGANALDLPLMAAVRDAVADLRDHGAPPLMLASSHPALFCPGWDLKQLAGLETHFQFVLKNKQMAVRAVLDGLNRGGAFADRGLDAREAEPVASAMVVVLTYWLSYEYVRDPRKALEPEGAAAALARGAYHVLSLLMPYLEPPAREHLFTLVGAYRDAR